MAAHHERSRVSLLRVVGVQEQDVRPEYIFAGEADGTLIFRQFLLHPHVQGSVRAAFHHPEQAPALEKTRQFGAEVTAEREGLRRGHVQVRAGFALGTAIEGELGLLAYSLHTVLHLPPPGRLHRETERQRQGAHVLPEAVGGLAVVRERGQETVVTADVILWFDEGEKRG